MKILMALFSVLTFLIGCDPAFAYMKASQAVEAQIMAPQTNTYSAESLYFNPPATPTDLCVISGVSGKLVTVHHVRVTGTQTTGGVNGFFLIKRSTADSLTGTALTAVPHDSYFVAAGADIMNYLANPASLGTSLGVLRSADVFTAAPAGLANSYFDFDFGPMSGVQPIVLHSAAETLALSFQGAALPSGLKIACDFTWTEK